MDNYFENISQPDAVKKEYRKLAMLNHPDKGGDLELMKLINLAYHAILKTLDGHVTKIDAKTEFTYKYVYETEEAVLQKLSELISLKIHDCTIALIGTWLWVTGNTKPNKDRFKALGLQWHSKRECWFFHTGGRKYYRSSGKSFKTLANQYGYAEFADTARLN